MFRRSEPYLVLNEKLDPALSAGIVKVDISLPQPLYERKKRKITD